jgi:H+/Cl- antiporter ClcA
MDLIQTRSSWRKAKLFAFIPFIVILIKYVSLVIAYHLDSNIDLFIVILNMITCMCTFIFLFYFMSVLFRIIDAILEH